MCVCVAARPPERVSFNRTHTTHPPHLSLIFIKHTPPSQHTTTPQLLTAARTQAAAGGSGAKAEVAIVETGEKERPTFIAGFTFNGKPFQVRIL